MPISVIIRSASRPKGGTSAAQEAASLPSLTFDGNRIVIGRGPGCEVRLPDPSVSQRHATLRVEGASYLLLDEGSTNGTYVGEVRLGPRTPRTVRNGDIIRVGRVWLEIRIDQTPATLDLPTATRDIAFKLVADAMRAIGDDVSPRVEVVEGPDRGRILVLAEEGRAYVAGRGEECDFALDDMDGSRQHLQIVRRGGAVLVRDLGSKNGAWLGESSLPKARDAVWRGPLMLRVGQNVLSLEEPVAEALAELESASDEPLPDEGAPPPPHPCAAPVPVPELEPVPGLGLPTSSAAAPLAEPPGGPRSLQPARARRVTWSGADLAVVVAAVSIIALSAAGLYWLLRG
jgi:pSer/pThr/pTyr-binding forkhead associated (FHA) protein